MSVVVERSYILEWPVSQVFHFMAVEHVKNHPRWDPNIHLAQIGDGPIGVGTVLKRLNTRGETPVEGTMEVTEFETDKVMAVVIHDGPMQVNSRITFDAVGESQTQITFWIEFPDIDEMDTGPLIAALDKVQETRVALMEDEL